MWLTAAFWTMFTNGTDYGNSHTGAFGAIIACKNTEDELRVDVFFKKYICKCLATTTDSESHNELSDDLF